MKHSANDELTHLEELFGALQRRLWVQEIQIAHYGIATPVHVVTEHEDTQQQLQKVSKGFTMIVQQFFCNFSRVTEDILLCGAIK